MGQDLSMANCPLRIVVLGKRDDPWLAELAGLPDQAMILAWGENLEQLLASGRAFTEGNVLFCASGGAKELGPVINRMPFLEWLHCLFAGIDHLICKELLDNADLVVTNAKGVFSSSLAEYVMLACAYFSKDLPRLLRNKEKLNYDRFTVGEIRGKTMGIVGYGDIGRSVAVLAKAYGMKILGLRRNPDLSQGDPLLDEVVGSSEDELMKLMRESDFLVVCAPLTQETRHMIGEKQLATARKGQILINIGRGPLIDEDALIAALQHGFLAGAALDVFTVEPLPKDSMLWRLPNVLLSPHNADMTSDFRHKSVQLFAQMCIEFVSQGCKPAKLDNQVDVYSGY